MDAERTIELLRAELAETRAALARAEERARRAERKLDHVTRLLELLLQHFGVKPQDLDELAAATSAASSDAADDEAPPVPPPEVRSPPQPRPAKNDAHNSHGRGTYPGPLPRDVRHHRPEACPDCGEDDFRDLGTEVTELLDYVRGHVRIRQVVRHKCVCRRCDAIVTAAAPLSPIARGACTAEFLAWLCYSKYGLHLPLERLRGELRREKVDVAVSTLCDWVGHGAFILGVLVARMKEIAWAEGVLHVDLTGLKVLRRGQRHAHLGHIAVFATRRWAIYDYAPTKEGKYTAAFLDDYTGVMVADAASPFDQVYASGKVIEAGCWAHALRKFEEAAESDPATANEAVAYIGTIFDIERDARERGLDDAGLLELRHARTAPVLQDLHAWLDAQAASALPKSPVGKSVAYCRRHWTALTRFVDDPRIPPDNNLAERCLRTVAVGRSNYTFAGSDEGARRAAVLYTAIMSCKLNDVDPLAWLTDIFARAADPDHRMRGGAALDELLPHRWKPKPAAE